VTAPSELVLTNEPTSIMSLSDELIEVGQSSKYGVYISVVLDIVAEVDHGRFIDWTQPDCADTKVLEVVKSRYNTCN
jgi:hypothetical protein